MSATSRTKVQVAVAGAVVACLAAYGLWSGMAEGESPSTGTESSATSGVDAQTKEPVASAGGEDAEPDEQKVRPRRSKDRPATDGRDEKNADEADDDTADDDAADNGAASPGTGAIVPTQPVATQEPVPLDSVGDFGTGLSVRLTEVTPLQVEAKAPGEIAGPGVRVAVAAANDGRSPVSLDSVVVFLSYGKERSPASQFGTSSEPLAGDLAPGGSLTGSYVYAVPAEALDDLRVEISYTGSAPTVAFEGTVDG